MYRACCPLACARPARENSHRRLLAAAGKLPVRIGASVIRVSYYFAAGSRAQCLPSFRFDGGENDPDRTVGQSDVDAAGMLAGGGEMKLVATHNPAIPPRVVRRHGVRV